MDALDIEKIIESSYSPTGHRDPKESERYTFQQKGNQKGSPQKGARVAQDQPLAEETDDERPPVLNEQTANLLKVARERLAEANDQARRMKAEHEELQEENEMLKQSVKNNGAYTLYQKQLNEVREEMERQKREAVQEAVNGMAREMQLRDDQLAKARESEHDRNTAKLEHVKRSNEQLQDRILELTREFERERLESDKLRKVLVARDREIESLKGDITDLRAHASREQAAKNEALAYCNRLQSEPASPCVEKQVTVEREGMKARTDLLRRVFDLHRSLQKVKNLVRDVRSSPTLLKLKNSTQAQYGREFIPQLESCTEELSEALQSSQYTIKMFFTTTEKLHCGMSSEWLKPEIGKPRALEEKITTTVVTTTGRSPSPSFVSSPPPYQFTEKSSPVSVSPVYSAHSPVARRSPSPSPSKNSSSPTNLNKVKSSGYAHNTPLKPISPVGVPRGDGARALNTNPYPGNIGVATW